MCLAIPGEITAVSERDGLPTATVRFGGVEREVCLALQPDTGPGDFVLVHVGMAIARIDRDEAERAWQVLAQLGQLAELEPETPPEFRDEPVTPEPAS